MRRTLLQAVVGVALVATAGVAAFFIAGRFAGGDARSQQPAETDEWLDDVRSRLGPTLEADRALPRARGAFGDFVIAGFGEAEPKLQTPCPRSERVMNDRARTEKSELYSQAFGKAEALEVYACPDGTITFIGGDIRHDVGVTEFGRFHYVGQAVVESDAPAKRLELASIGGHPALIEHGLDLPPFPRQTRIFVIERAPADTVPGIMLAVFTPLGEDEAIELAEELSR